MLEGMESIRKEYVWRREEDIQNVTERGMRQHEAPKDREQLYVGIDVQKKSWNVHTVSDHISHGGLYMKPPSMEKLLAYLYTRHPDAAYDFVYEAGFSGFGLQRSLTAQAMTV